jgi:hypothetical protein
MKEEISKYYTPSLDEFHFGFECEMTGHEMPPQWHKHIVNINTFNEWLFKGNPKIGAAFRVKYLDKEDIESLGFIYKENRGMSEHNGVMFIKKDPLFEKANFTIRYWVTTGAYRLRIERISGCLFEGNIRNKSELKVLLKQLGINE